MLTGSRPAENSQAPKQIARAMQEGEGELATRLAHTLKGVAGNVGAQQLYAVAESLENALKGGDDDTARGLLAGVTEKLEQVMASVATLEPEQIGERGKAEQTDLATLKTELDRLRELLEDDDSEATEVVEGLHAQLVGSGLASGLKEIEEAISGYDFEEALVHLETLTNNLNAKMETQA